MRNHHRCVRFRTRGTRHNYKVRALGLTSKQQSEGWEELIYIAQFGDWTEVRERDIRGVESLITGKRKG